MPLPQRLKNSSEEERLRYAINRFTDRTNFVPGKHYNLLIQKRHSPSTIEKLKRTRPHFVEKPGNGLIRRDSHWEKTSPLKQFRFRSRLQSDYVPDHRTALEDLEDNEDFQDWFEDKFGGLEDGVYTAIQNNGKGHGTSLLFLLKLEGGEVVQWKKKSNSQQTSSEGRSSQYYGFPLYFMFRQRYTDV